MYLRAVEAGPQLRRYYLNVIGGWDFLIASSATRIVSGTSTGSSRIC